MHAEWIGLQAGDGHRLRAWQARPADAPRGALVVLQEIFGVNDHIRDVCERHAQAGWLAVAPALFDRAAGPLDGLGYTGDDIALGRTLKGHITDEQALLDVAAAVAACASKDARRVAVIGYCWGGTLAWLAACRLSGIAAAVAYYGTAIAAHRHERPRVPVLLHFGDHDTHIPSEDVAAIAAAHPAVELHRYAAGHGFQCDARPSYDAASARLAAERTTGFLHACITP